jgi:hypothetical protein
MDLLEIGLGVVDWICLKNGVSWDVTPGKPQILHGLFWLMIGIVWELL